jgi:hypothetical protein
MRLVGKLLLSSAVVAIVAAFGLWLAGADRASLVALGVGAALLAIVLAWEDSR